MTIGQKIRRARLLRGMTQKELGLKVGFSASTADARIRQYEIGVMNPKEDKLKKIAEALDVDIASLSNIDIRSSDDLMQILFELETDFGLQLNLDEKNKITLSFNEASCPSSVTFGLRSWKMAHDYFLDGTSDAADAISEYEIWKSQYPNSLKKHEELISSQVADKYSDAIQQVKKEYNVRTIREIIELYESMITAGLSVQLCRAPEYNDTGVLACCTSFNHKQLLDASDEIAERYAKYNCMIDELRSYGITVLNGTHSDIENTFEDFFIAHSPITTALLSVVSPLLITIKDGAFEDDLDRMEYESDLAQYNVPIQS